MAYNRFHDQLVLSSSSDTLVSLWRVSSISSAPLLELDESSGCVPSRLRFRVLAQPCVERALTCHDRGCHMQREERRRRVGEAIRRASGQRVRARLELQQCLGVCVAVLLWPSRRQSRTTARDVQDLAVGECTGRAGHCMCRGLARLHTVPCEPTGAPRKHDRLREHRLSPQVSVRTRCGTDQWQATCTRHRRLWRAPPAPC